MPEMTEQLLAARAKGHEQRNVLKKYLDALDAQKPRRGRTRTLETVKASLARVTGELEGGPSPIDKIALIQERMNLEDEQNALMQAASGAQNLANHEEAFVMIAAEYAERKGISYNAFREAGVPADVLKRAGVPRTRRVSASAPMGDASNSMPSNDGMGSSA